MLLISTLAGSRLYGTHREDSDTDIRGVMLEPVDSLIGLETPFEQYELKDPDTVIYGLRKFMRLAIANNPNILDTLFAPKDAWKEHNELWHKIYDIRHDILHQGVRNTYVGYAYSQIKRVETHRRWAHTVPDKGSKDYASYTQYLQTRNPARHALEVKYGYDTKHAAHLVRLLVQAKRILSACDFSPKLEDDDLTSVLNVMHGKIPYDELLRWSDATINDIKCMESVLPTAPKLDRIHDAVRYITMEYLRNYDRQQGL